jgi:hypothetical protein
MTVTEHAGSKLTDINIMYIITDFQSSVILYLKLKKAYALGLKNCVSLESNVG